MRVNTRTHKDSKSRGRTAHGYAKCSTSGVGRGCGCSGLQKSRDGRVCSRSNDPFYAGYLCHDPCEEERKIDSDAEDPDAIHELIFSRGKKNFGGGIDRLKFIRRHENMDMS